MPENGFRPLSTIELTKIEAEAATELVEQAKLRAEIAKLEAETREAEAKAGVGALMLAREQRKERDELAKDVHNHRYLFNGGVADGSVNTCIAQLATWSRQDPAGAIEIVFNSPGGDVVEGMALFDYIQILRGQGHHVTTTTLGMAASMAGILLQAGDVRAMGAQSWLMIHEASFGVQGKTGVVEDRVEWVKKVQDRILDIFAARSKMSRTQIKNKWHRKDWWLSSDDALKLGFVDEIR